MATQECPCGYYTDASRECTCTPHQIQKYLGRISGPLLDRIDLHIEVPALKWKEISDTEPAEPSAAIRERISKAREIQQKRFEGEGMHCNAQMGTSQLRKFCALDQPSQTLLKNAWKSSASQPAPTTASSRLPVPLTTWTAPSPSSRRLLRRPFNTAISIEVSGETEKLIIFKGRPATNLPG